MAATWTRIGTSPRSVSSLQALSEAAPTSDDGVLLDGVFSVLPVIHAPNGQTLTGAGSLLGYVRANGLWVRSTRSDLDLADQAGLQDASLPALIVNSPREKFALIASGVGLSGAGTTVTIELFCINRSGNEIT